MGVVGSEGEVGLECLGRAGDGVGKMRVAGEGSGSLDRLQCGGFNLNENIQDSRKNVALKPMCNCQPSSTPFVIQSKSAIFPTSPHLTLNSQTSNPRPGKSASLRQDHDPAFPRNVSFHQILASHSISQPDQTWSKPNNEEGVERRTSEKIQPCKSNSRSGTPPRPGPPTPSQSAHSPGRHAD